MTAIQRERLLDQIDLARVELSAQLKALSEAKDLLLIHGVRAEEFYAPVIRRARAIYKHACRRIKS